MTMTDIATGACLCGAVRYEVERPLRDVVVCHCEMCRKAHGHVGAYTAAPKSALHISETRALEWYASSPIARRGFCRDCGSTLFWQRTQSDMISIAAGTVDAPTGLRTSLQIHVDSAGDYYDVDPRIPSRGN